ncbi:hypothetical protein [Halolactibacillus sp. JCM 19043]|uniref:hypothetical protein n=1 Tax=Halolactibacillus sp. JCM 19043 TaxID=1460638 RepID=UPI0007817CE8|nr:hypothetical protein [Halolactibacillus sp. JCM 19043]
MKKLMQLMLMLLIAISLVGCNNDESKTEGTIVKYEGDMQELITENSRLKMEIGKLEKQVEQLEQQQEK